MQYDDVIVFKSPGFSFYSIDHTLLKKLLFSIIYLPSKQQELYKNRQSLKHAIDKVISHNLELQQQFHSFIAEKTLSFVKLFIILKAPTRGVIVM